MKGLPAKESTNLTNVNSALNNSHSKISPGNLQAVVNRPTAVECKHEVWRPGVKMAA